MRKLLKRMYAWARFGAAVTLERPRCTRSTPSWATVAGCERAIKSAPACAGPGAARSNSGGTRPAWRKGSDSLERRCTLPPTIVLSPIGSAVSWDRGSRTHA